MGKNSRIELTGQKRAIAKSRVRKVEKYKRYAQYKKALKEEEATRTAFAPGEGEKAASGAAGAPPAQQQGQQQGKRRPKVHAAEAARRKWEWQQRDVEAEREATAAAEADRRREKVAARKRRGDQTRKLGRKTKRGQPVLANQVSARARVAHALILPRHVRAKERCSGQRREQALPDRAIPSLARPPLTPTLRGQMDRMLAKLQAER